MPISTAPPAATRDVAAGSLDAAPRPSRFRRTAPAAGRSQEAQDIEKLRHEIGEGIKYKVMWIGLLGAIFVRSLFLPWQPFSFTWKPSLEQLTGIEEKVTKTVIERLATDPQSGDVSNEPVPQTNDNSEPRSSLEASPKAANDGESTTTSAATTDPQPTVANPNAPPGKNSSPPASNAVTGQNTK